MSRNNLERMQLERVKAVISYAYRNVTYYRQLMDNAGIEPGQIRTLKDVGRIPISTKKDLVSRPLADILSKEHDVSNLKFHRTSGTTSEPMNVYFSEAESVIRAAIERRCFFQAGYRLTDRILRIGPSYDYPKHKLGRLGISRRRSIISNTPVAEMKKIFFEVRPNVLIGYPSAIRLLANEVRGQRLKMVFTGAEVLTEDARRDIEEGFSTKIFNIYGCWEFGRIAFECRQHSGLHINEDVLLADFDSDSSIIVTSLYSFAMPLIRYRLGDIIEPIGDSVCGCGCTFRKIKGIQGRQGHYYLFSDGKKLSSLNMLEPFWDNLESQPRQYKFIQKTVDESEVLYVRDTSLTRKEIAKIKEAYQKLLGPVNLRFIRKDIIPPAKTGKYEVFESEAKREKT